MIRENFVAQTGGQPFLDLVDKINELAETIPEAAGNLLTEETDRKVRDSTVKWIAPDKKADWLYREINSFISEMNSQLEWNFDIDGINPLQYTIYRPGQFYGWHPDVDVRKLDRQRKISFSIMLTDPEEYEGGDFVFYNTTCHPDYTDTHKTLRYNNIPKGEAIVFPSFAWHKVEPLVKGTRTSLVGWVDGPAWR